MENIYIIYNLISNWFNNIFQSSLSFTTLGEIGNETFSKWKSYLKEFGTSETTLSEQFIYNPGYTQSNTFPKRIFTPYIFNSDYVDSTSVPSISSFENADPGIYHLDMSKVNYVSSSGLAGLIKLVKTGFNKDIDVKFVNVKDDVKEEMKRMGLDNVLFFE